MIDYNTAFGDVEIRLKAVMDQRKMSVYSMSKISGIKYEIVKKYYNNENCAYNRDILAKFCFILNCKIEDLLKYIPSDNSDTGFKK